MIFEILASPGSLLGALGSLLVPLGVVLGRSWGLLGRSWAILGRSFGILRRSWVALGGSWFALGGSWLVPGRSWGAKRARRAAGQGAWRTRGKRSYPPPVGNVHFPPPPGTEPEGQGKRKTGLWNEEECIEDIKDHREEGRVRTKGKMEEGRRGLSRTPRGPGGRRIYSSCLDTWSACLIVWSEFWQ